MVGYLFLRNMLNDLVFGIIFGMVAGVMVYISIEELLPMAYEYDNGRFATKCFVGGMAIMALSLVLLG